jgi:hypothetical protein
MVTFGRDGVSEGQFYQVLLHELDAIRKVAFFSFPFLGDKRESERLAVEI